MTILGVEFTKISAERRSAGSKVNVNSNVNIKSIEEHNLNLADKKNAALKFTFEYTSKYEPDIGSIDIGGYAIYMEDAKETKKILADWKAKKPLPKQVMESIINAALSRSSIEAIMVSREVGLPTPVRMPRVTSKS